MRSGCSPMMLTFLTPGTCSSRWRSVSASRARCALRLALRLERIEREGDVAIFVVDERTRRRRAADLGASSLDLLARLVEFGLAPRTAASGRAASSVVKARPGRREGFAAVVPAQLLQALFERLGDLVLHLLRSGARPGASPRSSS